LDDFIAGVFFIAVVESFDGFFLISMRRDA
jgi:hypothetical protein